MGQPRPTVCREAGDERTTGGEADKTNRPREKYSPMRRNTRKQYYTSAYDNNNNKNSFFLRVSEKRQTTKEEGSKEEDRQGADVQFNVKNEYVQPFIHERRESFVDR